MDLAGNDSNDKLLTSFWRELAALVAGLEQKPHYQRQPTANEGGDFPSETVARVGIEPTTPGFSDRCSTTELPRRKRARNGGNKHIELQITRGIDNRTIPVILPPVSCQEKGYWGDGVGPPGRSRRDSLRGRR